MIIFNTRLMNFKSAITFLFLVLFSLSTKAQDYKANIKQRFTEYAQALVKGEYNKSMDYLPEAIFTIVPRAQMVALFEQIMKNKEIETKILGFDIKEISDSRKIDTCYYSRLRYVSSMSMKVIADEGTDEDKKNKLSLMRTALANSFGSDNVKLDEATATYTITPVKSSWAISKNGQTDWKFVNVEPAQRVIMEKLLPKALIEESLN